MDLNNPSPPLQGTPRSSVGHRVPCDHTPYYVSPRKYATFSSNRIPRKARERQSRSPASHRRRILLARACFAPLGSIPSLGDPALLTGHQVDIFPAGRPVRPDALLLERCRTLHRPLPASCRSTRRCSRCSRMVSSAPFTEPSSPGEFHVTRLHQMRKAAESVSRQIPGSARTPHNHMG